MPSQAAHFLGLHHSSADLVPRQDRMREERRLCADLWCSGKETEHAVRIWYGLFFKIQERRGASLTNPWFVMSCWGVFLMLQANEMRLEKTTDMMSLSTFAWCFTKEPNCLVLHIEDWDFSAFHLLRVFSCAFLLKVGEARSFWRLNLWSRRFGWRRCCCRSFSREPRPHG